MGVLAARGRWGRRLVGTCSGTALRSSTLLAGALLSAACLPRADLASYSSSAGGQGGVIENPPPAPTGGGAGSVAGQDGTETGPDSMLPLETGGAESSGAGGSALDAGTQLESDAASPPAEADAGDAGSIASRCAATQGTLEPGSNVCLFFASTAAVSWQAAMLNCQSRSSTLVSVKTAARNDSLTTLIGRTDIWIGAMDPGTDPAANAFVWRDGTAVDPAVAAWAIGEPDSVAGQFCVSKTGELAAPPGPAAPWRDRPCTELHAFVCEQTF